MFHFFLSSIRAFVASLSDFSMSLPVLQKPCFVFPNELGPADVGVSLPIFRIRILASLGISSGSSSLTSPNTAATDFDAGLGKIGGSFYKKYQNIMNIRIQWLPSYIRNLKPKLFELLSKLTVAGGLRVILIPVLTGKVFFIIPKDNFGFLSGCCFSSPSPSTNNDYYYLINNVTRKTVQTYLWPNFLFHLIAVLTFLE